MSESTETYNLVTASKIANVTPGTIRYWILTGRLKAEQNGPYWSISPDDLDVAIAFTKDGPNVDQEITEESTDVSADSE